MRLGKINNRAGALDIQGNFVRDMPCFEPTYFVGIDYTGDVVPCCNIRHDVDNHKPFVLGNLKQESLISVLSSKKAVKFRKDVSNMIFPDVCKGCSKLPGRYTSEDPDIMNGVS
jgi:radical SAM protein with 4Fe4S-binding SPASM domain